MTSVYCFHPTIVSYRLCGLIPPRVIPVVSFRYANAMNYPVENYTSWEAFGFKQNPYDTAPLIEGSLLPMSDDFVGRVKERCSV